MYDCVRNDILTNWHMKLDTNLMSLEAIVYSRCHYYHGGYAKRLSGDFVGTECSTETVCAERYPNSMQLFRGIFVDCIQMIRLAFSIMTLSNELLTLRVRKFV